MIYTIVALSLALTPFVVWYGAGDGIRTPKEIISVIFLASIIAVGLSSYDLRKFRNGWLFVFFLWCVANLFINTNNIPVFLPPNVVVNMPATIFAWKEIFYIILTILTIFILTSFKDTNHKWKFMGMSGKFATNQKEGIRLIANAINASLIIMCVYSIIQAVGLDNFFRVTNNMGLVAESNTDISKFCFTHRVVGTIGNPTLLATWISMCLPICLYLKNKMGYVGFILGISVVLITGSATALVCMVTALLFYFLSGNRALRKIFIIFLISIFLIGIFNKSITHKIYEKRTCVDLQQRLNVHKEMWKILEQRPLLGLGMGTFEYLIGLNPEIAKKLNDEHWRELHDEYGQIWFSVGLIGVLIFLGFIISVFDRFRKHITRESIMFASCMVAFLVACFTLFPMRSAPMSLYGVVFTGLLLKITRED